MSDHWDFKLRGIYPFTHKRQVYLQAGVNQPDLLNQLVVANSRKHSQVFESWEVYCVR